MLCIYIFTFFIGLDFYHPFNLSYCFHTTELDLDRQYGSVSRDLTAHGRIFYYLPPPSTSPHLKLLSFVLVYGVSNMNLESNVRILKAHSHSTQVYSELLSYVIAVSIAR